jgi:hypothetical protein
MKSERIHRPVILSIDEQNRIMIQPPVFYQPYASIGIDSALDLKLFAKELQAALHSAEPFGGRDSFLRNEDPAVFIPELLGFRIVLWHDLDRPTEFQLDFDLSQSWFSYPSFKEKAEKAGSESSSINISEFLKDYLRRAGFSIRE